MSQVVIREAVVEDAELILGFVKDLARFEKAEDEVVATVSDIRAAIFGGDATAKAIIGELDGKPVGFAVYFYNFSTWLGRKGLYLEDLYITPEYRGLGAGCCSIWQNKRLLKTVDVLSGQYWTGMSPPSSFMNPLVPNLKASGWAISWLGRH
ncbi:N-acetyltransferase family protein [Endozoicomonas sp.]|uniref:GNAT family N-acetyltransferase n=1 Tax=Endozoicomonas sp. TaxID=1892382 RepID=UPI003AF922A8